jgi:hypothetical protein
MAEEAVICEPFSGELTANNAGKCRYFEYRARMRLAGIMRKQPGGSAIASLGCPSRTGKNREFR